MVRTYSEELHHETTPQCRTNGVGCDGFHDDGRWCVCTCHGPFAPDFTSNQDVSDWHVPNVDGVKCPECHEQWASNLTCEDCVLKAAEIARARKGVQR